MFVCSFLLVALVTIFIVFLLLFWRQVNMRKLERLCRKLYRSCNRYFVVNRFKGSRYVVHEYSRDTQESWTLGSFRRVTDVECFLLDKFNGGE